jgi:pimeloyl-ACP methyl ester carboxylesterase
MRVSVKELRSFTNDLCLPKQAGMGVRMKKIFRIILKIIGITVLSIIGVLLIGCIIVAINSPGRLEPLKDSDENVIVGSLAEKNWVEIGGIQQGFFIRAENPNNPVILFLHGGPGTPTMPFQINRETSERLEKYFTVVYWEQRGAGINFSSSIDPATMTLDQLVEDTRQMTEYLQHRFGQEKIFLMGHSWGSYLGIQTIEKYPNNYLAYIGVGQVTNQIESDRLAYDYMLQQAKEINDNRAIRNLQRFDRDAPEFPSLTYIVSVRTPLMNRYGIGVAHNENLSDFRLGVEGLFFKGYTFSEKIDYLRGISYSNLHLWDNSKKGNLFESSTSFAIPVFIIHGERDYMVSYALAREWFDKIDAPEKEFFSFEDSAHSPFMEEPEKFVQIMRNIALQK